MVTKLDIFRERDGEDAWDMVDGKVTRVKEKTKVVGPVVKEGIKVVTMVEKKLIPKKLTHKFKGKRKGGK